MVIRIGRKTEVEQVRDCVLQTFCREKEAMIASNNLGEFFLSIQCNFVTCIGEQKLFVVEMRERGKGSC